MSGRQRARRRSIAATPVVLALGVALVALALVVTHPRGDSPVLAAIVVGSPLGPASIAVDEGTGRAYITAYDSSGGGSGHESVRVLDTARAALLRTTALPGQPFAFTTLTVDARRGRVYAASSGSTSCSVAAGGAQTCVACCRSCPGRPRRSAPLRAA